MELIKNEIIHDVGGKLSDFKILTELGRGSYGIVYKVYSYVDGNIYVIKKMDFKHMKEKQQKEAYKEAMILKKIKHPHIIKYYNSFLEDDCLYIVMEFAEGGDLFSLAKNYKKNKKTFEETELWKYLYEILLGLNYLHSNNIIHRDIKCLNLFLGKNKSIKIGDMGVSKIVSNINAFHCTRVGTPLYLSPELIKQVPYDFKVDIWSVGCSLYHLACLEPPFQGDNLIVLGNNIVKIQHKPLPSGYSKEFSKLVDSFLSKKPEIRPSAKEALDLIPSQIKENYNIRQSNKKLTDIEENYNGLVTSNTVYNKLTENVFDEIQNKKIIKGSSGKSIYELKQLDKNLNLENFVNVNDDPFLKKIDDKNQKDQTSYNLKNALLKNNNLKNYTNNLFRKDLNSKLISAANNMNSYRVVNLENLGNNDSLEVKKNSPLKFPNKNRNIIKNNNPNMNKDRQIASNFTIYKENPCSVRVSEENININELKQDDKNILIEFKNKSYQINNNLNSNTSRNINSKSSSNLYSADQNRKFTEQKNIKFNEKNIKKTNSPNIENGTDSNFKSHSNRNSPLKTNPKENINTEVKRSENVLNLSPNEKINEEIQEKPISSSNKKIKEINNRETNKPIKTINKENIETYNIKKVENLYNVIHLSEKKFVQENSNLNVEINNKIINSPNLESGENFANQENLQKKRILSSKLRKDKPFSIRPSTANNLNSEKRNLRNMNRAFNLGSFLSNENINNKILYYVKEQNLKISNKNIQNINKNSNFENLISQNNRNTNQITDENQNDKKKINNRPFTASNIRSLNNENFPESNNNVINININVYNINNNNNNMINGNFIQNCNPFLNPNIKKNLIYVNENLKKSKELKDLPQFKQSSENFSKQNKANTIDAMNIITKENVSIPNNLRTTDEIKNKFRQLTNFSTIRPKNPVAFEKLKNTLNLVNDNINMKKTAEIIFDNLAKTLGKGDDTKKVLTINDLK